MKDLFAPTGSIPRRSASRFAIAVDKALKEKMLELTVKAVKVKTGACISRDDEVLSVLTDCEIRLS
ncbi:MAG: hypothetical protein MJ159_03280 [Treponemataceae bacterium]|nr:hypothetical protein [Treponemataceae bacterium]